MIKRKIKRGDIYYANMDPVLGSEQGGYRPVLIVQNNRGNLYSPTVIVAAITSRLKHKMSTHVMLGKTGGLEKNSVVLLEQIRTLDKRRLRDYVGTVDRFQMQKIDRALRISLQIKRICKPLEMCLCSECMKPFIVRGKFCIRKAGSTYSCMLCGSVQECWYLTFDWKY